MHRRCNHRHWEEIDSFVISGAGGFVGVAAAASGREHQTAEREPHSVESERPDMLHSHALGDERLAGPVNAVSPHPVTNAEFTDTLARVVHRPALFPVPALALNLMFGEMAQATLLVSQRVVPRAMLAAGFSFRHASLESALRAAVNE